MTTLRDLIDRYTDAYHEGDEATFLSMVADGCVRHDPGSTVAISHADNLARFRDFRAHFPGARFTNAHVWQHGDDTITVCYTVDAGETVLSGMEVFRFAEGRIVEVWNAPAGAGRWS
jgi:predicted SnoaL-like aldol condensation-catalyzing enzyme